MVSVRARALSFMRYCIFFSLFSLTLPLLYGQMVSPSIDEDGQPFSYYSQSTDQIGVMNAPAGTEITPEGYLYTGYGELLFYVGPEKTPVSERIRTLQAGFLPIVSYQFRRDGILYRFTMFSASLGEQPEGAVVNFVRVSVKNLGSEQRTAFLTTAFRYQAEQTSSFSVDDAGRYQKDFSGENRFSRPVQGKRVGAYSQIGEPFNPDWIYSVEGNAFLRDGRVLYTFPSEPNPRLNPTLRDYYNRVPSLKPKKLAIQPTTPTSTASYKVVLPAGAERSLDFKMPLIPMQPSGPEFAQMQRAGFEDYQNRVTRFWTAMVDRGMQVEVSEEKVNQTFKTSLIYDLMARNKIGEDYVQTINQFQYHGFYLRDSADFIRMYDTTGYPDIADQVLSFFPKRQDTDGNFLSQPGQFDGWGEALWTYGEHYRMNHDKAFAASVYPRLVQAFEWFVRARAGDSLHLMPATDVKDNEYVAGHLTGYNFLALDGLRSLILLAKDLGHTEDAARFQREYDDYRATVLTLLDKVTAKTGGYIPPDLDGNLEGTDWGNLLSLTPELVLDPMDPKVTATLKTTQARYQEGLITYNQPDQGTYLHHYLTIKNTLSELIRGEQEQALREFYAELMHTSSTHAGFEYAIRPWGMRDFQGNLAPHGWFAAEYRNLLRCMMVREQEGTLHLLSAVSPEWIGAGKSIRVERANTYFGVLGFTLHMDTDSEARLLLQDSFTKAPQTVVLHLPWFMKTERVVADGKELSMNENAVVLPSNTKEVTLRWSRKPQTEALSYSKTVDGYKKEYRVRYQKLIESGEEFDAHLPR